MTTIEGVTRLQSASPDAVVLVVDDAILDTPNKEADRLQAASGGGGRGLVREDGSIDWGCPCLGGMASGPCGPQFREAFSCFHYSTAEPKGSECYEKFSVMQQCMSEYPELYGRDDDDENVGDIMASAGDSAKEGDSNKQEANSTKQTADKHQIKI